MRLNWLENYVRVSCIKKYCGCLVIIMFCSTSCNSQEQHEVSKNEIDMSKKIKPNFLSVKDVKVLIENRDGKYNKKLSDLSGFDIYLLNDDGILIVDNDGGTHYEKNDKDAVIEMLSTPPELITHETKDLPYGKQFVVHVDDVIQDFVLLTGIDSSYLDKSLESIKYIDDFINKQQQVKSPMEIESEFFYGLIAYSGEVLIKENQGNWVLREYSGDGGVFSEPLIVKDNLDYELYSPIMMEIHENKGRFSLYDVIDAELNKYKMLEFIKKNAKKKDMN